MGDIAWPKIAAWGPTVVMFALVLWFLLKIAPTWKELRLRELDVREGEVKVKGEQAAALGQLGTGLSQMSETLKEIAVEQRRATESVKILQRVNADTSDQAADKLLILTDRVDRLEKRGQDPNVDAEGRGTKPH